MTDQTRVIWTRWLVIVGILLGYVSYGTKKLGFGEIYPFADWRLYSAPIGINEEAATFRVYSYDEASSTWQRHPLQANQAFTRKEAAYIVNYWSRQVKEDSIPDVHAHTALEQTAGLFAPDGVRHRIVEETFYSLPLYEDPERYDTSTVATFDR